MANLDDLSRDLTVAYEHLYDIAYLRAHPLNTLPEATAHATQDRGWQTHHALIKLIDELNPGGHAPAMSREWRRHRLMRLRFVEGLTPQEVADALAISRRQYYRVHDEAMRALAGMILLAQNDGSALTAAAIHMESERPTAHPAHLEPQADLRVVLDSATSLLRERLSQRSVRLQHVLPAALPLLQADDKLLRQLVLSLLDFLVERSRDATLILSAGHSGDEVMLTLNIQPAISMQDSESGVFEQLADLTGARVEHLIENGALYGFSLRQRALAKDALPRVLAVDDNDDTLELYRRYLEPHGYQVAVARNSADVFDALLDAQPMAIFLDLMLPEQDGWDILQLLKNEPDAQAIPVFICSVLMQKELALSLGAVGFLQKPFTPATLLAALDGLKVSST